MNGIFWYTTNLPATHFFHLVFFFSFRTNIIHLNLFIDHFQPYISESYSFFRLNLVIVMCPVFYGIYTTCPTGNVSTIIKADCNRFDCREQNNMLLFNADTNPFFFSSILPFTLCIDSAGIRVVLRHDISNSSIHLLIYSIDVFEKFL